MEKKTKRSPLSIQTPAATWHPLTSVLCPTSASPSPYTAAQLPLHGWPFLLYSTLTSLSCPAGSNILLFLGTTVTTRFLSGSWYRLRARTQSQPLSVLTTPQSCHLQWNAQEALVTHDPRPSSKCDLKVGMAHREGTA